MPHGESRQGGHDGYGKNRDNKHGGSHSWFEKQKGTTDQQQDAEDAVTHGDDARRADPRQDQCRDTGHGAEGDLKMKHKGTEGRWIVGFG